MSLLDWRVPTAMSLTALFSLALSTLVVAGKDRATLHLSEGHDRPLALYNAPPSYDSGRDQNTAILMAPPTARDIRDTIPTYSLDCEGKSRCSRTIHHRSQDVVNPSPAPSSRQGRERSLRSYYNDFWGNSLGERSLPSSSFLGDYYVNRRSGQVPLSEPIDDYFNGTYLDSIMDKGPVRNSSSMYDPFQFRSRDRPKWPAASYLSSMYPTGPQHQRPYASAPGLGGQWVSLEAVPYTSSQVSKWVPNRNDLPYDRWTQDRPSGGGVPNRVSSGRPGSYWGVAGGSRPTQHWDYEPAPNHPSSVVATASPSYFSSSWDKRPYKHATIDKVPSPGVATWNRRPGPGLTSDFNPSGSWHRPHLPLPQSLNPNNPKRPPTLYNSPLPYRPPGWDSSVSWDRNKPSGTSPSWDQWAEASEPASSSSSTSFWTQPDSPGPQMEIPEGGSIRPGYTQIDTEDGGTRWVLLSSTKGGMNYSPTRVFSERSLSPLGPPGRPIMSTRASIRLNVLPQVGYDDSGTAPVWPAEASATKWTVTRRPAWYGQITAIAKPSWEKPITTTTTTSSSTVPSIKPSKNKPSLIAWPNKPSQGLAIPDYFDKLNATLQSLRPVRIRNRKKKPLNTNLTFVSRKYDTEGERMVPGGKFVYDYGTSPEARVDSGDSAGRAINTAATQSNSAGSWVSWPTGKSPST